MVPPRFIKSAYADPTSLSNITVATEDSYLYLNVQNLSSWMYSPDKRRFLAPTESSLKYVLTVTYSNHSFFSIITQLFQIVKKIKVLYQKYPHV